MQPSLLHDGANRSLTENTRLEGTTSPQAENAAPQKCEADFRSDVAYSVGVRLSAFFADLEVVLVIPAELNQKNSVVRFSKTTKLIVSKLNITGITSTADRNRLT